MRYGVYTSSDSESKYVDFIIEHSLAIPDCGCCPVEIILNSVSVGEDYDHTI